MNQIINMMIRLVMRKVLNKGIDAGFAHAGKMRGRKNADQPQIDDYGNPVQSRTAQQEIRAERRARREGKQQTRQAKQAMKVTRRLNKF